MLLTINNAGTTLYRVECDGCGLNDTHRRRPGENVTIGQYEIDDAYVSAACIECENSPRIIKVENEDLCQSCRVEGKMSPEERLAYTTLATNLRARLGDEAETNDLLARRIIDCDDAADQILIPLLNMHLVKQGGKGFIISSLSGHHERTVNGLLQCAARELAKKQKGG